MNRIDKKFIELSHKHKTGLIAYITGGDPTLNISKEIITSIAESGVDLIEIGIPFSDPLADGPVIQNAVERSLSSGTTVKRVLTLVQEVRKVTHISIVLFTYLNPILKYGLHAFVKDAKNAGADGSIVLDLPPEESHDYIIAARSMDFKTIYLIAPTSSEKRIDSICQASNGFIYCVSRTGVTGSKTSSLIETKKMIRRVKKYTKLPIAVGFGVSEKKQVKELSTYTDAVVIGSAIVRLIEANQNNPVPHVKKFIKGLV